MSIKGHHCGENRWPYWCKKPPGHEGEHKDRLWLDDRRYFYHCWIDDLDGGGGYTDEACPRVPRLPGVMPA